MIDNSRLVLENNIEYLVVDKINVDNKSYVYLLNPNDNEDLCIRKEVFKNGTNTLVGLDDEVEFNEALDLYLKKNREEI